MTITAKQLESELGRSEAIGQWIQQCEVAIDQLSPELDYRREDLSGFVVGCWPCEGSPYDVAAEFVEQLAKADD